MLLLLAILLWCVLGVALLHLIAGRPPGGQVGQALAQGCPLDPGEAGLVFETWTLELEACVSVPVWDIEGTGRGPATVLIHDWGEAPLALLNRANQLTATCSRIIVPCLRGHCPGSGRCRLGRAERNDLKLLIDHLDEPVAVEGRGMGRYIVEGVNAREKIASVMSEDPWRDPRDGLIRIMAARGFPAWPIVPLTMLFMHGR